MCLIAASNSKANIPMEALRNAEQRNHDGWGIMYALDGQMYVTKEVSGFNAFGDKWAQVPDGVPCAVHFRFATKGAKDETGCHPFKVSDDRGGIWMMHNGTMHRFGEKNESDTAGFARELLLPSLGNDGSLLNLEWYRNMLAEVIGSGNKLLFLTGEGDFHIINARAGHYTEGNKVWYSNTYSIEEQRPVSSNAVSRYYGGQRGVYSQDFWEDYYEDRYGKWDAKTHTWVKDDTTTGGASSSTGTGTRLTKSERKALKKLEGMARKKAVAERGKVALPKTSNVIPITESYKRARYQGMGTAMVVTIIPGISAFKPPAAESEFEYDLQTWMSQNLRQMTDTEVFNTVIADPMGATEFICRMKGLAASDDWWSKYNAIIKKPEDATDDILALAGATPKVCPV